MTYDGTLPPTDDKPYSWADPWTDQPTSAGHDECLGIHLGPEGPVDCDGRPI